MRARCESRDFGRPPRPGPGAAPHPTHAFGRIIILWMVILSLAIFTHALYASADPVTMAILPQVPRKGDPVMVTFNLNNPALTTGRVSYDFFINGDKVKSGSAWLTPLSTKKYTYAYLNNLDIGEYVQFRLVATLPQGSYQKSVSLPAYPPQVWSSFVSFASFSTSFMGSMGSMVNYRDSFLNDTGAGVGLVFSLVLLALLAFRDLTGSVRSGKSLVILPLRLRLRTLAAVLLIIFSGIVFTRVVMIFTI